MTKTTEVKLTCDHAGCRKTPGGKNDRIEVVLHHTFPEGTRTDVPPNPLATGATLDFCSWEHAAATMTEIGKERARAVKEAEERQPAGASEEEG